MCWAELREQCQGRVDNVCMTRRRFTPDHGTRARYVHRNDGCRCPSCTRANAEYLARYRARRAGNDG